MLFPKHENVSAACRFTFLCPYVLEPLCPCALMSEPVCPVPFCLRPYVSSYVYGVFGAQRSRDCTVTVLVSQIKRGHVTAL